MEASLSPLPSHLLVSSGMPEESSWEGVRRWEALGEKHRLPNPFR